MQKRYCTCGSPVWVSYVNLETDWSARFFLESLQGARLWTCPKCGRKLDIDELA